MTIHSVLHILLANTFKHISCPVRLSLHVMAATGEVRYGQGTVSPSITNTTVYQNIEISHPPWITEPSRNFLSYTTSWKHPLPSLGDVDEKKSQNKKNQTFKKPKPTKFGFKWLFFSFRGDFQVCCFWMVGWWFYIFTTSQSHYYQKQDETRDLKAIWGQSMSK